MEDMPEYLQRVPCTALRKTPVFVPLAAVLMRIPFCCPPSRLAICMLLVNSLPAIRAAYRLRLPLTEN